MINPTVGVGSRTKNTKRSPWKRGPRPSALFRKSNQLDDYKKIIRRGGGGEGRASGWEREGTVVGEVGEVGGADEEVHGVAAQAREEHEVHR